MENNTRSKVTYLLVGLGIGGLLGILFAPQSGQETREYLAQKADEGKEFAQRKARELRDRANDLVESGKLGAIRQKDSVIAAVEAGQKAYQREAAKGK